MFYYLLLTSITVSIDSFFCGLSLGLINKNRILLVFIFCSVVYLMCAFTNCLCLVFTHALSEKTACIGGIILIFTGVYNLFKKEQVSLLTPPSDNVSFLILNAFAVGIDGAIGNLSLALMGINAFYVPIIIAGTHAVTVFVGTILADVTKKTFNLNTSLMSGALLSALGYYKLLVIL